MTAGVGAVAGVAAAHAAAVNALKASGVVVRLEPAEWLAILGRTEAPLVVVATGGVFKKHVRYLTSYRGLAFFTQSPQSLILPREAEVIEAQSISVPDV
jgi:hypothetical protein